MSGCLRGELDGSREGKYEGVRVVPGMPKSFLDARFNARVKALPRDGEEDRGGGNGCGGGGKAVFEVVATGPPDSSGGYRSD